MITFRMHLDLFGLVIIRNLSHNSQVFHSKKKAKKLK